MSPATAGEWGGDVLGEDTLPDGNASTITFTFNPSKPVCEWDLKVIYSTKDESAIQGLNLCKITKATLRWNEKLNTTTAQLE